MVEAVDILSELEEQNVLLTTEVALAKAAKQNGVTV